MSLKKRIRFTLISLLSLLGACSFEGKFESRPNSADSSVSREPLPNSAISQARAQALSAEKMYSFGKEHGVVCISSAISPEDCLAFVNRMANDAKLKTAIQRANTDNIPVHLINKQLVERLMVLSGAIFIDISATNQEIVVFLLGQ